MIIWYPIRVHNWNVNSSVKKIIWKFRSVVELEANEFLPFQGLLFFVNLAIKISFLFVMSRVLQIEFWNLACVFIKCN